MDERMNINIGLKVWPPKFFIFKNLVNSYVVHPPNVPRKELQLRMNIVKHAIQPLDRQILEALMISNADVDLLLNSGAEWVAGESEYHHLFTDFVILFCESVNQGMALYRLRNRVFSFEQVMWEQEISRKASDEKSYHIQI